MRLIFIRHGHPDYSTDSLTALGQKHAAAAAERLAGEGIDAVFASPLGRAQQTAAYTAQRLGLPVTTLPFMRELNWGGAAYNPWLRTRDLARAGVDLLHCDLAAAPGIAGGSMMESAAAAAAGFDAWLAELGYVREGCYYRCTAKREDTLAIFSHAGSSSAVIAHLLAMPAPYFVRIVDMNFTAVSVIRFDGEAGEMVLPWVEILNDFRHINGITAE